jgi:hypothetical protein
MKRKIYKLLSSTKQGFFALALTVFSGIAYSQTTYTFNYTGSTQTIILQAGSYSIECWGGDGGGTTGTNANAAVLKLGGKGGYAKGTLTLSAATTASVYVGGKGNTEGLNVPGGFNGGGNSGGGTGPSGVCGSGGGASDVRVGGNAFSDRKIVAGGGGAAGYQECNGTANAISGGHGGGLSGAAPVAGVYAARIGQGGTQTAGGAGGTDATYVAGNPGSFGLGGNGGVVNVTSGNGAGGGGGWYGGGSGSNGFYCAGGGGGGSSYIGGVTSATTIMFGQPSFVTNPDITGNGRIIITELCNITLVPSTTNTLNPSICSGQSLTLTTNAISNYSWSTGAITSSLVVSPTTSTVYALTATSPSNCTASRSISVTVSSGQPTLAVVSSTNQTCLGKTATLTASGAVTYTWSNSITNGASFNPSVTTVYTVTGQNGCGTATATTAITVAPLPVSLLVTPTIVCAGSPATLNVSAAATSFSYLPINASNGSGSLIVAPTVNTTYTVAVSDGTCAGIGTISLATNPVPTINVTSSGTTICQGTPLYISATGGINYTWTPGNLSGASVTVNPTSPTAFVVVGNNAFGCTASTSTFVVTTPSPTITIAPSANLICSGQSVTLTASGATNYNWSGGASTATTIEMPTTSGVITVTGTASGCAGTETVQINVYTASITLTGSTTLCNGNSVNLVASGANNYTWNPGSSTGANITVAPAATTIYTLSTETQTGNLLCPANTTVQVTVLPTPVVTAAPDRAVICKNESATLTANGAASYSWTGLSTGASVVITSSLITTITYTVVGTGANGCKTETTTLVKINSCNGLNNYSENTSTLKLYPNPSSGAFTIEGESTLDLSVINELGQVIKTVRLNESNNYKSQISGLSNGIYFITGQDNTKTITYKVIVNK